MPDNPVGYPASRKKQIRPHPRLNFCCTFPLTCTREWACDFAFDGIVIPDRWGSEWASKVENNFNYYYKQLHESIAQWQIRLLLCL